MFREDLEDLMELTEKKMENISTACTFLIGFALVLMVEGRLEPGTPDWLLRAEVRQIRAARSAGRFLGVPTSGRVLDQQRNAFQALPGTPTFFWILGRPLDQLVPRRSVAF